MSASPMIGNAKANVSKRRGRRAGAARVFGEQVENVCQVQLKADQPIATIMQQVGGVALERYSDGSLFFSGQPTPQQCTELGITAKPKWRTEVRNSRVLNLSAQVMEGGRVPRLSVEDAVCIVKQSPLWADRASIEHVQVVNRAKSAHVYVQFDEAELAKKRVNWVDAQSYEVAGQTVYMHSLQLNVDFEHAPDAADDMVWQNPVFRKLTVSAMESAQGDVINRRRGSVSSAHDLSAWSGSAEDETASASGSSQSDICTTEEDSDSEKEIFIDTWAPCVEQDCHVEYDESMLAAFYQ
eukprot:TRINITY_DN13765_c0_g2_i1.p1 TRINITY_DN13765_c0_g2~~TRINITY_DN13765_c0_g2_i1.p1  ORF type:complete len:297 (+),score=108.32 TRINITY_DN13765_c0_g2_i1:147-1037(+)